MYSGKYSGAAGVFSHIPVWYNPSMAELKTKKNAASVIEFIRSVDNETRRADAHRLLGIFRKATGQKPVMWGTSMIGFGEYHYKSERSTQEGDWPLAAFSPRKANLTVYIMPGFKDYGSLLKKLGKHKISGGSCIYINKLADVDEAILATIIKRGFQDMKKRHAKK